MNNPLPATLTSPWTRRAFQALMLGGAAFIAYGSVSYIYDGDMHPFIMEKVDAGLPLESVWTAALYTHVVAALLSFPACVVLMSRRMLRVLPRAHRWLGRATGAIVLLTLVPSGAWMALWAKGGALGSAGFLLSGAIVAVAMVRGIQTARAKQYVEHRRMTAHVTAQLSVAVTSRLMLIGFDRVHFDPETAYLVALWVPVVASALVAEILTNRLNRLSRPNKRSRHETRVPQLVLDPAR